MQSILAIILTCVLLPCIALAQEVAFSDDFQGDLSAWSTVGYGVLVSDSLDPGNQALAFSHTANSGNMWSNAIRVEESSEYLFSFRYRGTASGVDSGGYLGLYDPHYNYYPPNLGWGTQPENSPIELIDDGEWHTYELIFHVSDYFSQFGGTLQIVVEDWDGAAGINPPPNVAGDAFFDDFRLTKLIVPSPTQILFSDDFEGGPDPSWIQPNGGWEWVDGHMRNTTTCGFQSCMPDLWAGGPQYSDYVISFDLSLSSGNLMLYTMADVPAEPEDGQTGTYVINTGSPPCGGGIWLHRQYPDAVHLSEGSGDQYCFDPNVVYRVKFGRIGQQIFYKKWPNELPEPQDWLLAGTDDELHSGYWGISFWNGIGWIDNVLVEGSGTIPPELPFADVTDDYPGLDDHDSGNSVAWVDYDNDGDLDLSVGAGENNINRLFLNRLAESGAVSFGLSSDPLIANRNTTRGLGWGIFDPGDRCPDLYQGLPFGSNVLLSNSCGAVVDVTTGVTAGTSALTNGVRMVDFDRDGRLDIHELRPDAPDRLLRNLGEWQFEEMPISALSIVEGSFDGAWGDADNDGDQDVYVTRDAPWPNVLLRNDGGGVFAEVTAPLLAITDRSQGATWGDYDNDGDLDLFVSNWLAANHLFRNDGSFNFTDVSVVGMDVERRGQSSVWGDLDNNGWLDLYIANQGDANQLWLNVPDGLGGRTFEDVTYPAVADLGPSTGVGMADYDQDGDLDIYVGAHLGANTLLRNEFATGNHWLEVDLVATRSNASSIGSRLTLSVSGLTMTREVGANNGMWSQEPLRQHFGLGDVQGPIQVAVAWPSGAITDLTIPSADCVLTITEPEGQSATFTDVFAAAGFANWTYVNQANVVDFNGDGWDDLFFARRDNMTPRLYLNDRFGRFVEDSAALGQMQGQYIEMVDFGDIDNDGDLDVLARMANRSLRMYLRDGGDFSDATPVTLQGLPFEFVGMIDSDNDGDLDIIGIVATAPGPGELTLFINDGASYAATTLAGGVQWVTLSDLDGNGHVDIVTSGGTSHRIFDNRGMNVFAERYETGLPAPVHYPACPFDFDNDGDMDIYSGNPDWNGHPWLSRNEGSFTFADAAQASLSVGSHYYAAAIAGDPDRDGDLDYYNTLGAWTDGLYFENNDGSFAERSIDYGIHVGGGNTTKFGVWIDYDRDHDLDLLVVNTWNANGGWLFRNDVTLGNWLEVRPIASESNSSLRGTRVVAYWGGHSQVQDFENNPGPYPYSRSRTKFFGLGSVAVVDSIVVCWPSGVVSVKRNIPANNAVQIQEIACPQLTAVVDVPNDQGGAVSLTFSAIVDGTPDGGSIFTGYEVQRWDAGVWLTAATLPAQGVEPYQVTVETPDVLTVGQPSRLTRFRVAATATGFATMCYSNVDSAYSIDNLPPSKPSASMLEEMDSRTIIWNRPTIPDLGTACVYRGSEAGFIPGEPIDCPTTRYFEETDLNWYFYRVQFSDIHGNVSEFSDELHGQWPTLVPSAVPTALRLYPCQPNPFNPRTTIKYDLPESGPVRLSVFDVAGRLVRTLVDDSMPQGSHEAFWDGRDATGREVGSGSYLARLEFGGTVEVVRMGLVR